MELPANHVPDFQHCKNPGDFFITPPNEFDNGNRTLDFLCPCGCGIYAGIRIRDDGTSDHYAWTWDRNEEKPTCTPSILINDNHWHGYLTEGVFRSV